MTAPPLESLPSAYQVLGPAATPELIQHLGDRLGLDEKRTHALLYFLSAASTLSACRSVFDMLDHDDQERARAVMLQVAKDARRAMRLLAAAGVPVSDPTKLRGWNPKNLMARRKRRGKG